MRKRLQLLALIMLLPFMALHAQVTVSGTITTDTEWTSDNEYVLDGVVFVASGARLFIEAGTVIKGEDGDGNSASALVVSRGGQIFAEGTPVNPI
ncbi:MAG: T9SS C-terminal target domain-containing protein, partial [Bacteroidetes bacterium]|nr:T9SS C-terminal target domain-containing protein [Bacteroidota bacterium]